MKTKLEIGKEYWLGESRKFKGIYKGSLGKAHYFYITYGDDNFTHDSNGFVEFPLHGVFEIEQWQFTTPIAMKCTEEQFNEIKGKLVEMGYILYGITFGEKYRYLSSNFDNDVRCITDLAIGSKYFKECNPIIFESFNPDLFLALAAMTDKEDGIKGEWWKNPYNNNLFIQTNTSPNSTHPYLRKATAQDIIEHFEKKEFVLPEKWYVCPKTKENLAIILSDERYSGYKSFTISNVNNAYTSDFEYKTDKKYISSGYTEITSDQFKKYVLKETEQSCQIISIPPTKQATVFDDRVEITDWEPKEGDWIYSVVILYGKPTYRKCKFAPNRQDTLMRGKIFKTESEARQLVEKLKQAML